MTSTTEPGPPQSVPATPLLVGGVEPPPADAPQPKTVPALPLVAGGVPKPPRDAAGGEDDVVVEFPAEESVGMLVLIKKDENPQYVTAQGRVVVPAGWYMQLNLLPTVTDAGFLAAADPYAVRVLTAAGLDDAGVRSIAGLQGLVYLSLGGNVTDTGLETVSGLANVTSLSVQSAAVTDAGAEHIARMSGLQSLHLAPCSLTDEGLRTLAGLPKLGGLSVRSQRLTNGAVEACSTMGALEKLALDGDGIDDRALPALSTGFERLAEATITGPGVTSEGVMAAFARGLRAQLNGQWFSPKAVERMARKASGN